MTDEEFEAFVTSANEELRLKQDLLGDRDQLALE